MPVNMPRRGEPNTEPPDMVRVQLKPNDVRSYRRRDAEQILADTPGAFILGEEREAAEESPKPVAPEKAQPPAPNKARQGAGNK